MARPIDDFNIEVSDAQGKLLRVWDEQTKGSSSAGGKVECLGKFFENDQDRRRYFSERLREKLLDQAFRNNDGFPIGVDEDILRLSDPPYYTACPNPFLKDLARYYGTPYEEDESYSREPFAADVSEGKNDPIYSAHAYHTKVPHKAIMRYILHYTNPGDLVLDGFCGTGMTGVAAQMCGDKNTIRSLGYQLKSDNAVVDTTGQTVSQLGSRKAIICDLSPIAAFIAHNYTSPIDLSQAENDARKILQEVKSECGWMYKTLHKPSSDAVNKAINGIRDPAIVTSDVSLPWADINYVVWSDVLLCSECASDVVFWDAAVDREAGEVNEQFQCPQCHANLTKRSTDRAWTSRFDGAIQDTIKQIKQVPVLISYTYAGRRYEKKPDKFDCKLVDYISDEDMRGSYPLNEIIDGQEIGRLKSLNITNVFQLLPRRASNVLARILAKDCSNRTILMVTAALLNLSWMYRWRANGKGGTTSGTYYICATPQENNAFDQLTRKFRDLQSVNPPEYSFVSTNSATELSIPDSSIDYIFTDPPFGGNLMYSELNYLWESWIGVQTNNKLEAIENSAQRKGLPEYQSLMTKCFTEYYRVLKPSRWITVEFHNSKNSVWNAIQEALQHAGFVIADVRTLDKKQGTFKQVNLSGAVKQDLIISAYKPSNKLAELFVLEAGTEDGAWDFVRTHLAQLPVFVSRDGKAESIAERQNYLLFDRMVAFHVQRGVTVPLSASAFYAGLDQRFSNRDGMYFLPDQASVYEKKRMAVSEVMQLDLFVSDEASAIQWLRQQLQGKPQTFQEIHPHFLRELAGWAKHEMPLELSDLLEQNFLQYDGKDDVPNQIHSYLSTNFREMRNLQKNDALLQEKAKDRWYVPDPTKAGDLEKIRERALLKEFDGYRCSSQKRLKVFRIEAVRAGFKKAWQDRDYQTIVVVAEMIPDNVLQEDPKLIMWYDQAVTRIGG